MTHGNPESLIDKLKESAINESITFSPSSYMEPSSKPLRLTDDLFEINKRPVGQLENKNNFSEFGFEFLNGKNSNDSYFSGPSGDSDNVTCNVGGEYKKIDKEYPSTHSSHTLKNGCNDTQKISQITPYSNVFQSTKKSFHTNSIKSIGNIENDNNVQACPYFSKGLCKFGDLCRNAHQFDNNRCPNCDELCLPNSSDHQMHASKCAETKLIHDEYEFSKKQKCGICYEFVIQKGQKFGLLTDCAHPFCLDCIRE